MGNVVLIMTNSNINKGSGRQGQSSVPLSHLLVELYVGVAINWTMTYWCWTKKQHTAPLNSAAVVLQTTWIFSRTVDNSPGMSQLKEYKMRGKVFKERVCVRACARCVCVCEWGGVKISKDPGLACSLSPLIALISSTVNLVVSPSALPRHDVPLQSNQPVRSQTPRLQISTVTAWLMAELINC